jgi:ribosomal protein L29
MSDDITVAAAQAGGSQMGMEGKEGSEHRGERQDVRNPFKDIRSIVVVPRRDKPFKDTKNIAVKPGGGKPFKDTRNIAVKPGRNGALQPLESIRDRVPQRAEILEGQRTADPAGGLDTTDSDTAAVSEPRDDGREASDGSAERGPEPGRESDGQAVERAERGKEHGQGGNYDRAGAERDRDRLDRRLDQLSETLVELRGKSADVDSRVSEIRRDIADLKAMVNELAGSGGQSPGATFEPVAQLSVIEDDALAVAEDDDSVPHEFSKRLLKMFRGIWALLWRLLSRFRMMKEWSLSGELGTAPFMGKVAVSVTFGR